MSSRPRLVLDPDAPWEWSRGDVLGLLSDRQRRYVESLEQVFRVKRADGSVVPYVASPFQIWYHAHSLLAMGWDAPNRLMVKSRGIGATLMTAMDLLLLAHHSPRIKIPVAGRQQQTGDEFIEKAHDLIQDVAIPGFFDVDQSISSKVRLGNKTQIVPIPGGSPNQVRSFRSPALAFDEVAFHPEAVKIRRAARGTLSEGGQASVLSTHDGADTLFYQLVEDTRAEKVDYVLFDYPAHTFGAGWDRSRSVTEQVRDGSLKLLAHWLDPREMDKMLREDPAGYEQEYLAQVIDEARNLLSRKAIMACLGEKGQDWERVYPIGAVEVATSVQERLHHEALATLGVRVPFRPEGNLNPVGVAVDFASQSDMAGFAAWEAMPEGGYVQRWCCVLQKASTPMQVAFLRFVVHVVRPYFLAIDQTGGGTGLFEYADEFKGVDTIPVHFSSKGSMPNQPGRVPIKKALALTTSRLVNEKGVRFVGPGHPLADLQIRHMRAIRRADLDAPKKKGEGHADLFWANAMALYLLETMPAPAEEGDADQFLDVGSAM